jgi:hypothetical protein
METGVVPERELEARDWPLELLEREIGQLAAHIHAATARWLLLVAEYDRREGWAEWGCKSCAHWLSHTCGLAPCAAREHLRVARRLPGLPLIRAAFLRGELSYSKVRALTRVATAELDETLLEIARYATAAQLERTLRSYRAVVKRELSPDEQDHGDRYVVCEWDEDGSLLLRARLPAEEGALVVRALEAGRDSLRGEPKPGSADSSPAEPSSEGQDVSAEAEAPDASSAQALVLMAETVLDRGVAERCPAESYQVLVHVEAGTLAAPGTDDEAASGVCELDDGPLLDPETARRLACDASVVRILERDGRPLSVGRRTRSVPPALRRALQSRDRCCRFPGCAQRRHLHAHHIEHWAHGGATELSNLVHLCRFHHRLVHEGGYTLERAGRDASLRFRRADGSVIPAVPAPWAGRSDEVERRHCERGLEIGPDTCASLWTGERLDLPLAVDALVVNDSRLAEPPVYATASSPPGFTPNSTSENSPM